jgi:hypothetical protein
MMEKEAFFPRLIIPYLKKIGLDVFYMKHLRFFNYSFVCGCGVLLNTAMLYLTVPYLPLFLANWLAIIVAYVSNYLFSIGPLGYLFGLGKKK